MCGNVTHLHRAMRVGIRHRSGPNARVAAKWIVRLVHVDRWRYRDPDDDAEAFGPALSRDLDEQMGLARRHASGVMLADMGFRRIWMWSCLVFLSGLRTTSTQSDIFLVGQDAALEAKLTTLRHRRCRHETETIPFTILASSSLRSHGELRRWQREILSAQPVKHHRVLGPGYNSDGRRS